MLLLLEFRHLERTWARSPCPVLVSICSGLGERFFKRSSGLSLIRALMSYIANYNTIIHKLFTGLKCLKFHVLIFFWYLFFSAHLLRFWKLRVLSLVPYNLKFHTSTPAFYILCAWAFISEKYPARQQWSWNTAPGTNWWSTNLTVSPFTWTYLRRKQNPRCWQSEWLFQFICIRRLQYVMVGALTLCFREGSGDFMGL